MAFHTAGLRLLRNTRVLALAGGALLLAQIWLTPIPEMSKGMGGAGSFGLTPPSVIHARPVEALHPTAQWLSSFSTPTAWTESTPTPLREGSDRDWGEGGALKGSKHASLRMETSADGSHSTLGSSHGNSASTAAKSSHKKWLKKEILSRYPGLEIGESETEPVARSERQIDEGVGGRGVDEKDDIAAIPGGGRGREPEEALQDVYVMWNAPLHSWTGTASEAIDFLLPLASGMTNLVLVGGFEDEYVAEYATRNENTVLEGLRGRLRFEPAYLKNSSASVYVTQYDPGTYKADAKRLRTNRFDYRVGRAMFETTGLPAGWKEACELMDEIWVPSKWGRKMFAAAGVPQHKLVVMPESVDCDLFDARIYSPDEPVLKIASERRRGGEPAPSRDHFAFLAVGKWEDRKGWVELIRAFVREFRSDRAAHLYVRSGEMEDRELIRTAIKSYVRQEVGDDDQALMAELVHRIVPLDRATHSEYPLFFAAADAFVLPTHGEGWGRPLLEAMAMGLPVIATNWSGQTEFMNEHNSVLLPVDKMVPAYPNEPHLLRSQGYQAAAAVDLPKHHVEHQWATVSVAALQSAMRRVYEHPELREQLGKQARADVERLWCRKPVARIIARRLQEIKYKVMSEDE